MPWSDWQDPFEAQLGPTWAILQYDSTDPTGLGQVAFIDNPFDGNISIGESTSTTGGQRVTTAVQFRARDYWAEFRDSLPPGLDGLEEGVDFDVIPGRERWQDDAFVEYDPDAANIWDGWGDDDTAPHTLEVHGDGDDPAVTWTATGSVGLALDTGYPETTGTKVSGPPNQAYPWASHAFTASMARTEFVDIGSMPDPGNVTSFTIVVSASMTSDSGLYIGGGAFVTMFRPYQRVILPRWRYWVPDKAIPLRQRQRDDGLGLSATRWRKGRSLQSSNRWKGYL